MGALKPPPELATMGHNMVRTIGLRREDLEVGLKLL